jgi:hypothetical protein
MEKGAPEIPAVLAILAVGCSPPGPPLVPAAKTAETVRAVEDVAPTTPETLAPPSADFDIVNLVIDSRFVYWAHRGEKGLVGVPLAGGPPITLVAGNQEPITSLAADATSLYFTTGRHVDIDPTGISSLGRKGPRAGHFEGVVVRLKKEAGAKPEEVASGRFEPGDVAVDAANVYWINAKRDATLVRQAVGQVDAQAVVAHGNFLPGSLVVSGGFAYWIDTDAGPGVMRVSTQGGEPQRISVPVPSASPLPSGSEGAGGQASHPVHLAADDTGVYLTDAGPMEGEGSVLRFATATGTVTVLAEHLNTPRAVVVHAGWVYWLDKGTGAKNFQDGSLQKAPVAGGTKTTLAAGLLAPDHLAVSETRVGWSEINGAVKDLAR